MSESIQQQDAKLTPAAWQDIKRDMDNALNGLLVRRLASDAYNEQLLETIYREYSDRRATKRESGAEAYQLVEEISTRITTNAKEVAPDLHKDLEDEISAISITDLLALFKPNNEEMWASYTDEERQAVQDLASNEDLHEVLRHHRFLEKEGLAPVGQLEERIKEWIAAGHAKKALEYGSYALMAGMLIAAPPMAAGMAASMAMRRTVLPFAAVATDKIVAATEAFVVDRGLLSQEQVDAGRNKLNAITQKITGSKFGRFSMALGTLAVAGAASSIGLDAVSGDELGTRLGNLWDSAKGLVSDMPGASEAEISATEAAGLEEADPDGQVPDIENLAHPDGGVYREALAERFAAAGHVDVAEQIRSLEGEQLDATALQNAVAQQSPLAGYMSLEQLEQAFSQRYGVDLAGLSEAAQQLPDVHAPVDASVTPETIVDAETPAEATDVSPTETAPEPAETGVISITYDVAPGDTLSEAVYDAYRAEGVSLNAAQLYGPSEYTSHSGGIIGEIAALNGLSDPNLINPNQTLSIEVHTTPGAEFGAPSTPATPQISEEAISAAEDIAGRSPEAPQVSTEAIEAAQSVAQPQGNSEVQAREGGFSDENKVAVKDAIKSNWLAGVAGAAGLTAVAVGVKRLFGKSDKEEQAKAAAKGESLDSLTDTSPPRLSHAADDEVEKNSADLLKPGSKEKSKPSNEQYNSESKHKAPFAEEPKVILNGTYTSHRVDEEQPADHSRFRSEDQQLNQKQPDPMESKIKDLVMATNERLILAGELDNKSSIKAYQSGMGYDDLLAHCQELSQELNPSAANELEGLVEAALVYRDEQAEYKKLSHRPDSDRTKISRGTALDSARSDLAMKFQLFPDKEMGTAILAAISRQTVKPEDVAVRKETEQAGIDLSDIPDNSVTF